MRIAPMLFLVGCLLVGHALGATPPAPRIAVTSLPGWHESLPSKNWAGYLPCGPPPSGVGSMYMHYWWVEAESNPETAPVIVWYNGGPGASSLFGLLLELGPLELNVLSLENPEYNKTGIPQMVRNLYAWSKFAHVIALDNPPPVGFSYCDPPGPTGGGRSCGNWTDSEVAVANKKFLVSLFEEFSEFSKNEVYMIGESYAGVYVPTIVRQILADSSSNINLKGFSIGDGCIGTEVLCGARTGPYSGPFYFLEFMHGHGQFSNSLYRNIRAQCPEEDLRNGNLSSVCKDLSAEAVKQVGGYYDYNLYDDCEDQHVFQVTDGDVMRAFNERSYWGPRMPRSRGSLTGALNDYPCPGNAMDLWLNRTDVRKALGVPVDSFFFSEDNGNGFNYTLTERNLLPFYKYVAEHTDLRVLIYNGDTDPGINSMLTQDIYFEYFTQNGISYKQQWTPWTLDGRIRMGGYVTEFEAAGGGSLAYLTIRGSGHMVPEFKPAAAAAFMSKWINKEPFPSYCPTC